MVATGSATVAGSRPSRPPARTTQTLRAVITPRGIHRIVRSVGHSSETATVSRPSRTSVPAGRRLLYRGGHGEGEGTDHDDGSQHGSPVAQEGERGEAGDHCAEVGEMPPARDA